MAPDHLHQQCRQERIWSVFYHQQGQQSLNLGNDDSYDTIKVFVEIDIIFKLLFTYFLQYFYINLNKIFLQIFYITFLHYLSKLFT